MKNTFKIIAVLALSFLITTNLTSCRKKLKGENLLYEGTWTNGQTYMELDSQNGIFLFDPFDTSSTYVKTWLPGDVTMTFEESGKATYYRYSYSSFSSGYSTSTSSEEKEIKGKVKIKNNTLTVKFAFIKEEFTITKPPANDAMGRYMVLSGDTFRLEP